MLEHVTGVVGPSLKCESLVQLAVRDDHAESVAMRLPEERHGNAVALAVVEPFHRAGGGGVGHHVVPPMLVCSHGSTVRSGQRHPVRANPNPAPTLVTPG